MSNILLSVRMQLVLSMSSLPQLIAVRHTKSDLHGGPSELQRKNEDVGESLYENMFKEWQHLMDQPLPVLNKQVDARAHSNGTSNLCIDGHLAPELMFLGAQKTGSTSLAAAILRHPRIKTFNRERSNIIWNFFYWDKETHVFDALGVLGRYGVDKTWWLESYPRCDSARSQRNVAADFTPDTLAIPEGPARILAWYGSQADRIKFYICLRDPVARAHSAFHLGRQMSWWSSLTRNHTFSQYVALSLASGKDIFGWPYKSAYGRELELSACNHSSAEGAAGISGCVGPLAASMYDSQLRNFLENFDSRQFTIYLFLQVVSPREGQYIHDDILEQHGLETLGAVSTPQGLRNFWPARPELSDDLNATLLQSLEKFMEERTGPKVIASILASSNARLYDYAGNHRDEDAIAQWISRGWR